MCDFVDSSEDQQKANIMPSFKKQRLEMIYKNKEKSELSGAVELLFQK